MAHLKFFRQPYPLRLNNYQNIQKRRQLNIRKLQLQPHHLLPFNNFCGTIESPKRENQGTSDLSHTILILNQFFVFSLVRVITSNKQQFVVALYSLTFSFFRTSLPNFSFFIFSTICLNVTNSTLTVSGQLLNFWQDQALDTVLMTKVYWKYSTSIVRVCFTRLLPPTLKRIIKRKSNLQVTVNSLAMTGLYQLFCYHSHQHSDLILEECLTFIHSTLT